MQNDEGEDKIYGQHTPNHFRQRQRPSALYGGNPQVPHAGTAGRIHARQALCGT
ncbi:MAG: hypothetical protein AAGF28_09820 [Pseudomonadota bacterium]